MVFFCLRKIGREGVCLEMLIYEWIMYYGERVGVSMKKGFCNKLEAESIFGLHILSLTFFDEGERGEKLFTILPFFEKK
jgi:hypothetical protein